MERFLNVVVVIIVAICIVTAQHTLDSERPTCGCCPSPACPTNSIPCSANMDCQCLFMTMNAGGICADIVISCNDLTPCENDNMTCSTPNTVCVNNTRCNLPVCFPMERASSQWCPPFTSRMSNITTFLPSATTRASTTPAILTTSTTSTTSTSATTSTTTTTSTSTTTSTTSTTSTPTTTSTTSTTSTSTTTSTTSTTSTSTTTSTTTTTSTSTTTTSLKTTVPNNALLLAGVQLNLDPNSLPDSWSQCYNSTYNSFMNPNVLKSILGACYKQKLMLGCRPVHNARLTVAAMGLRTDVLYDCGRAQTCTHVANGVGWYYSDDYSWGFANSTDAVIRNQCDTGTVNAAYRLCWHTLSYVGGYRCGTVIRLNNDVGYERVIYHAN